MSQQPSFDLYPGLDGELNRALDRNAESGTATPEAIASHGVEAALQEVIKADTSEHSTEEAEAWIDKELENMKEKWSPYGQILAQRVASIDTLRPNPNFSATVTRLHEVKQALDASGEMTADDQLIGGSMHLVAVPWQFFRDSLEDLPQALKAFRRQKGVPGADCIYGQLTAAITSGKPLYKVGNMPRFAYTARKYLDYKIDQDGQWGIMLAQTSEAAGVKSWASSSLSDLMDSDRRSLRLDGQPVGDMGIFEWLAFTLQETPYDNVSTIEGSFLPANRIHNALGTEVPFGYWTADEYGLSTLRPDKNFAGFEPRLAVL